MIKNKLVKYILIILFIIFIITYYISINGYYEYQLSKSTILTNDKIKEFENDIRNGLPVDAKTYLVNDNIDYSNQISNLIYGLSNTGTKITRKLIKRLFKKLSYLLED